MRWRAIEDLRPHLDPIVLELGRMPTISELAEHGCSDLKRPISTLGGYPKVAEVLGYRYAAPTWKWRSPEDLRPHLAPIVRELGRMPTQRELIARGRVDLTGAIRKLGGIPQVSKALGYTRTARGSWQSVEELRPHLDPFVAQLGRLPRQDELRDAGRSDLLNAIARFGGLPQVTAALGYAYLSRHSWRSVEDLRLRFNP